MHASTGNVATAAWTVALLGAAASSALAQPRYAVGEISVIDGHPVKGVGAIFRQSFDTRCDLIDELGADRERPIAGSIATRMELAVSVIGCDVEAETPPALTCSTRVGADPPTRLTLEPQSHEWANWTYVLPLQVPDAVGAYDVALDCDVAGAASRVDTRLFATYAKPLVVVSPPEIDWLERATAWAAGIEPGDELGLVEALHQKAYAYGREHWRYGYGRLDEQGRYWFQGHASRYRLRTGPDLQEVSGEEAKCYWDALLDPSSSCNFADCYVFSRVLQFTAATLGVGGLINCTECNVTGEDDTGFLTHPGAQSLDDEFSRNVFCDVPSGDPTLLGALQSEPPNDCPSYYFAAHSLLWRNDRYYDTTFNGIYDRATGGIAINVAAHGGHTSLVDASASLQKVDADPREMYGDWSLYRLVPEGSVRSPAPDEIRFTSRPVHFERVQLDDHPLVFEKLKARVEVDVGVPGVYSVWGYLAEPGGGGRRISSRAQWDGSEATTSFVHAETGGLRVVELEFSGEEIYRSGVDGPYELRAFIDGHPGDKKCASDEGEAYCRTPADYRFEQFGEQDIKFERTGVTVGWSFDDEDYGSMVVYVPLSVREPRPYAVQLALLQGETSVAYGGMKCESPPCEPVAVMKVPRSALVPNQGTYFMTAEVFTYPTLFSQDAYRLEIETPSALVTRISRR